MATTVDIDTGGTFTDGFVVRDGVVHTVKTLTTPHDLAVCFRRVIEAAAAALGLTVRDMLRETVAVRYATTVGTNAVIQRRGPRLGLLTDRPAAERDGVGVFVDPDMVAAPHADAEHRNGDGPSSGGELAAIRRLLGDGARGLVAAGTGSTDRVAATFAEHYPRHCLDAVPLLCSADVTADTDPARATATALFNAYVHPEVAEFLHRAEDYLREQGYDRPLRIVHNDGGAARVARTIAGKTYNSGPMAGLLGAGAVARRHGIENLVTLDMGGTSLDVGIVRDGEVRLSEHGRVAGVEISFPLPELLPLGIGGGSIAWLDGATPRVGPRSAGAAPGPACFGFGGDEPTLTDADVVLGVLRPESFLGGGMPIDVEASRRAFSPLAAGLGCGVEQAAGQVIEAAHRDAGAQVAAELARHGVDPAATTALAFGGNGATHCAGIAQAAGIGEVLVLPFAPVFSAYGASTLDVSHRHAAPAADTDEQTLRERVLRDMRGEGVAVADVEIDVRESTVHDRDGVAVAWLEVRGRHELPHARPDGDGPPAAGTGAPRRTATLHWPGSGECSTTVADLDSLGAGDRIEGPALVDSRATTCRVPPGWVLTVDGNRSIRLRHDTGRNDS